MRSEKPKPLPPYVKLLRDTTWKCGRVEKAIVEFILDYIAHRRIKAVPVKVILDHFTKQGISRGQVKDALKRLEARRIITFSEKP